MKTPDSCISIVGMPTSGKTTLGMQLADALNRPFSDSDQLFIAEQGVSIHDYVARHGWPPFRSEEEKIIEKSIQPNAVLSLGGGAIESAKTREVLTVLTHVVWIRAELKTILDRWSKQQKGQERPQLTGFSVEQETREKFERRNPLLKSVAEVIVEAEETTERQIEIIRKCLRL